MKVKKHFNSLFIIIKSITSWNLSSNLLLTFCYFEDVRIFKIFCFTLFIFSLSSCHTEKLFNNQNPYESYVNALDKAGLQDYSLAKTWIKNGKVPIDFKLSTQEIPHSEMTYFDPGKAEALFWQYKVEEGSQVNINAQMLSDTTSIYFLDVFRKTSNGYAQIHFSNDHRSLAYTVKEDGEHLLRMQPELLEGGMVVVNIDVSGSIAFPISEMHSGQIASFWGDARAGGSRRHEGVDVFAKRGTPVLAVARGRVSKAGQNRLGGNVVWLNTGRYNYYYAHLDSQLVQSGKRVKLGDTLGTVGNTGNARTTSPHLHFGVYSRGRGAKNPLPFLQSLEKSIPIVASDSVLLKEKGVFLAKSGNLRASPNLSSKVISSYPNETLFDVLGKSGDWFRIKLPDHTIGYGHKSILNLSENNLGEIEVKSSDLVFDSWNRSVSLPSTYFVGNAEVLGYFNNMLHVRLKTGPEIWLLAR
tara:strand:- start:69 stop:1478 length:1410 start_codon:yes stop_codon:yes gene_type:complete